MSMEGQSVTGVRRLRQRRPGLPVRLRAARRVRTCRPDLVGHL